MKSPYDLIIKPVLSEKSMDGVPAKHYTFIVAKDANKTEIRQALEEIFGVKVESVNTVTTLGKIKRQGKFEGRRSTIKKAMVILKQDSKGIDFFDNMTQ